MPVAGGRRRLDAASRRESILAAALPEFARSGYERTRVADIAALVGVTEPVLFQNFGTKAGLFAAVLERAGDEVAGYLDGLSTRGGTVLDALERLLAHEHQDRLHDPGGLGAIFVAASDAPESTVREAAHKAHARSLRALAGLINRGQAEGSIRSDVNPAALAGLVLSQIHARQIRRSHTATSASLETAILNAVIEVLSDQNSAKT